MPSGFQQDQNQLTPGYYRVLIEMGANSPNAEWDSYENAPTDGKITPLSWDACSEVPTTQDAADALARGNLRFQAIVETLENVADCQILDIETDADDRADQQANNGWLAFTVKFDRNEFVGPAYNKIQQVDGDEDNNYAHGINGTSTVDGVVYNVYWSASPAESTVDPAFPEQAIRDLVWRALARPNWSRSTRVYNVEGGEGVQEVITVGNPTDGDNNMFADINVTELNGTSTTIVTD